MKRESLENTVVVVTTPEGEEVEVQMDLGIGNLNEEATQCLLIGRAVRDALMTAKDGAPVEVAVYSQ